MNGRINGWLLAALGLFLSGNAIADEMAERDAISRNAAALMRAGDFAGLEKLSTSYRQTRARTASGVWKLTMFYLGVRSTFDAAAGDDAGWSHLDRHVKQWIAAYPDSPSAHLAYARMLLSRGWKHRGGGYAHSVAPGAWSPFHAYVEEARQYLETHKAVASQDPYWYEQMAVVGYVQGWPEAKFASHIDEGLDREPLFYQTYFAAVDYYAPKWRGTPLAIERFAMRALRRTRETEGYGMYARIYWYASQTQFDERLFTDSVVDWKTMSLGIDDVLKAYPDMWNTNNFAYFACLSRDREKTAELIGRITGEPLANVWKNRAVFEGCRDWATPPAH